MKLAMTALTLALAALGAQAGTFDDWSRNGSAQLLDAGDTLRLTNITSGYQVGSAWAPDKVSLSQDFSAAFSFRIADGTGADGITFTIQDSAAGASAAGFDGGWLGYESVNKSIAFVYDTWENGYDTDRVPGANTSVTFGGSVSPWGGATVGTAYELRGKVVYSWVDFSAATGLFSMYISDTALKPLVAQETILLSQSDLVGSATAYVGFTAATGGSNDNHDILSASISAVPESDAAALALTGVALALALVRRQRKSRTAKRG